MLLFAAAAAVELVCMARLSLPAPLVSSPFSSLFCPSQTDYLIRSRLVKTQRVADAMRAVDRGRYIDPTYASQADAYQV